MDQVGFRIGVHMERGVRRRISLYNATLGDTLNLYVEDDDFRVEQLQW